MSRTHTSRRLGGAIAAAAVLAAVGPAAAQAAPTCAFHAPSRTLQINDPGPGIPDQLGVKRGGNVIVPVRDGVAGAPCTSPPPNRGQLTVLNVDTIVINAPAGTREVLIDQSSGAFAPGATAEPAPGKSEIELQVISPGADPRLHIIGTPGNDTIRMGAGAATALNADADVDVTTDFAAGPVDGAEIDAGDGADFVTGRGAGAQAGAAAAFPLRLVGGTGDDVIVDGLGRLVQFPIATFENDSISGGQGADFITSDDGSGGDEISGGDGIDRAISEFTVEGDSRLVPDRYTRMESVAFITPPASGSGGVLGSVGRLRLDPGPRAVRAGGPARVGLRWTAPGSWKSLARIGVRLYDGGAVVGGAVITPRRGGIAAGGPAVLRRGASRMTRNGRSVGAQLAWTLPRGLAGRDLRIAVEATDRRGRIQSAPSVGLLRVR